MAEPIDSLDDRIRQAELQKLHLEITNLKRWWMNLLPMLAVAATLLGLLVQQRTDFAKRQQDGYQDSLRALANASEPTRVSAVLALRHFATDSRAEEVGAVLVNQLVAESNQFNGTRNGPVVDALLLALPDFPLSVVDRLMIANRRDVMSLSTLAGRYIHSSNAPSKSGKPLDQILDSIGLRISLTGLPFEELQAYRFVPIRIWPLIDGQRYGLYVTQDLIIEGRNSEVASDTDPIVTFMKDARLVLGDLYINTIAIAAVVRSHATALDGLSLRDARLIAPDFHGLNMSGVQFDRAVLLSPNITGANLGNAKAVALICDARSTCPEPPLGPR